MRIVSQTITLMGIQAINLLGPLVAIPVILQRASIDVYSQYAAWITFSQFSIILLDLGYSIYGAKVCSSNSSTQSITETITTSVIFKILLFLLILTAAIVFADISDLGIQNAFFIATYVLCVSVQPIYYFIAANKMRYFFWSILVSKLFFLIVISFWNNLNLSVCSAALMLSSMIGLLISFHTWSDFFNLRAFNRQNILSALPFLSSRISIATLMQGSVLLIFNNVHIVQFAFVAFADQLYRLAISSTTSITQVLLPAMANGLPKNKYFLINSLVFLVLLISVLTTLHFLDAVLQLFNFDIETDGFGEIRSVFYIYGLLVLLNFLSRTFGYPLHINNKVLGSINHINLFSLALYLFLILILFIFFSLNAFTILMAFVIAELSILLLRVLLFYKSNP